MLSPRLADAVVVLGALFFWTLALLEPRELSELSELPLPLSTANHIDRRILAPKMLEPKRRIFQHGALRTEQFYFVSFFLAVLLR